MKEIILTKDYKIGAKTKKRGTVLQVINGFGRQLIKDGVARPYPNVIEKFVAKKRKPLEDKEGNRLTK